MAAEKSIELQLSKYRADGNGNHSEVDSAHITSRDPLAEGQIVKIEMTYNNLLMQKIRMVGNLSLERFDIIKVDKI